MYLLSWVITTAFGYIFMVDGLAGGGEVPKVLMSTPGGLFPMFALLFKTGMGVGAGAGWQFSIGGWLVFIFLMMVFSMVQGFVLTYFSAAGVVNYHLLTQDDEEG
jgi:hypothetical protein